MTDIQLYLSIGIPVVTNAALFGLLMMYINAKLDAVNTRFDGVNARFGAMEAKFDAKLDTVNARIDGLRNEMNAKFDAQREGLHRVEEVLDARLKHIEDREHER